jgi:hypothetical protein
VEGERRADGVAAQALPALEVVGVDADAGVERETVEADAVAGALEGLWKTLAPVHLGGLERASEALDRGYASGPRIGRSSPPGEPALPGEHGAGEEVEEEAGAQLWAAGR